MCSTSKDNCQRKLAVFTCKTLSVVGCNARDISQMYDTLCMGFEKRGCRVFDLNPTRRISFRPMLSLLGKTGLESIGAWAKYYLCSFCIRRHAAETLHSNILSPRSCVLLWCVRSECYTGAKTSAHESWAFDGTVHLAWEPSYVLICCSF